MSAGRRPLRIAACWALTACAALLLAAAIVVFIRQQIPQLINSDSLYAVSVCRGFLGDTWTMTHQHLPGAPYFFPDIVLLTPCAAAASDVAVVFLLYALLYYLLLACALAWVSREAGLPWREACLLGAGGVVLLLATHLDPAYQFQASVMGYPGNHMGTLLMGLVLSALVLRSLRQTPRLASVAVFVFAGGISIFSDKLLVVQFMAPLALALALLACLQAVRPRQLLAPGLLLAGAELMSLGFSWLFRSLGFELLATQTKATAAQRWASCRLFVVQFPALLHEQYALIAVQALAIVLATLLIVRWARLARGPASAAAASLEPFAPAGANRAAILVLALLPWFSWLCTIGAVVGTGNWGDPAHFRYFFGPLCLPLLLAAPFVRLLPWRRPALARTAPLTLIVAFAFWQIGVRLPDFAWSDFHQPYPAAAEALDRLARERGVRWGLAGFWSARYLQFVTREHVHIGAVVGDGEPWPHADNPSQYIHADPTDLELPRYQFVLFHVPAEPMEPDRECVRRGFGEPQEKQTGPGYEIWLYDEITEIHFRRFLEGVLAEKVRGRQPFESPVRPVGLAAPKRNLTPSNTPGAEQLAAGETLEIDFGRPVSGTTLDIAADFLSEYELTFYRGPLCLGAARVPPAPWTGGAYLNKDVIYARVNSDVLYARLVPLPEAVRQQQWDRVLVHPVCGVLGRHRIGHFLLYHDFAIPPPQSRAQRFASPRRFEAEKLLPFLFNLPRGFCLTPPSGFKGGMLPPGPAVDNMILDASASGGAAHLGAQGQPGVVCTGPWCMSLEPGRYRADFALKATGHDATQQVAVISATSSLGKRTLARQEVDGTSLSTGEGYHVFQLTFQADEPLDYVEFHVESTGAAELSVDYVDLTALSESQE